MDDLTERRRQLLLDVLDGATNWMTTTALMREMTRRARNTDRALCPTHHPLDGPVFAGHDIQRIGTSTTLRDQVVRRRPRSVSDAATWATRTHANEWDETERQRAIESTKQAARVTADGNVVLLDDRPVAKFSDALPDHLVNALLDHATRSIRRWLITTTETGGGHS